MNLQDERIRTACGALSLSAIAERGCGRRALFDGRSAYPTLQKSGRYSDGRTVRMSAYRMSGCKYDGV